MEDESVDTARENYHRAIDQLLDSLTADEDTYSGIVRKMPSVARAYRFAARQAVDTATDEMERADYTMTAERLLEHTAALLAALANYRNRKGLMHPSYEI
jgi:hypothetical protein